MVSFIKGGMQAKGIEPANLGINIFSTIIFFENVNCTRINILKDVPNIWERETERERESTGYLVYGTKQMEDHMAAWDIISRKGK